MTKLIAITGGMAAGKSTLLSEIRNCIDKNIAVLSVDDIIRGATDRPELLMAAADVFYPEGCAVYKPHEYIFGTNRDSSTILFNYSEVIKYILESKDNYIKWQRFWCNKVQSQWLELQAKKEYDLIVLEFPMLFESGLEYQFDKIVFVETHWRERMNRFISRGYSAKDFWDRERLHYSPSWKKEHSDLVVQGNLSTYNINEILFIS